MVNPDLALYDVKKNGRGSFRFFNNDMRRVLDLRKKLEDELRDALDKQALEPFFQPQVDVRKNKVTGIECLVRWKHSIKGYIPPIEGLEFGRLGLNASAQELREDDFSEWLIEAAERFRFPLNRLSVELLETVIVDDEKLRLSNKIKSLRDVGIHVELDDFGTGYASLRQVDPDEISRLKIDRSFITDINTNHKNAMIVRPIVDLTQILEWRSLRKVWRRRKSWRHCYNWVATPFKGTVSQDRCQRTN